MISKTYRVSSGFANSSRMARTAAIGRMDFIFMGGSDEKTGANVGRGAGPRQRLPCSLELHLPTGYNS